MILGGRSLHDLVFADFQTLVENRIPEGPNLDYKATAYSGRSTDIREMLRDVVALANADGGYLVLGIEEDAAGRALRLAPIDEPQTKAQAINQACLDGIVERVPGLEVKAYEIAFNQGIIVLHVPSSDQAPHMMARDHSTDFVRRYGTDKRPLTLGEIRETILGNPRFRRLVELELQSKGEMPLETERRDFEGVQYVQILTSGSVEKFLQRHDCRR
ncbi:MAG: ATP-binding protein [Anaerolineales bacterium]|nr:ATP-binding protein [Anaerolineales bacterium]